MADFLFPGQRVIHTISSASNLWCSACTLVSIVISGRFCLTHLSIDKEAESLQTSFQNVKALKYECPCPGSYYHIVKNSCLCVWCNQVKLWLYHTVECRHDAVRFLMILHMPLWWQQRNVNQTYRKVSNISHTKSLNLNVYHFIL